MSENPPVVDVDAEERGIQISYTPCSSLHVSCIHEEQSPTPSCGADMTDALNDPLEEGVDVAVDSSRRPLNRCLSTRAVLSRQVAAFQNKKRSQSTIAATTSSGAMLSSQKSDPLASTVVLGDREEVRAMTTSDLLASARHRGERRAALWDEVLEAATEAFAIVKPLVTETQSGLDVMERIQRALGDMELCDQEEQMSVAINPPHPDSALEDFDRIQRNLVNASAAYDRALGIGGPDVASSPSQSHNASSSEASLCVSSDDRIQFANVCALGNIARCTLSEFAALLSDFSTKRIRYHCKSSPALHRVNDRLSQLRRLKDEQALLEAGLGTPPLESSSVASPVSTPMSRTLSVHSRGPMSGPEGSPPLALDSIKRSTSTDVEEAVSPSVSAEALAVVAGDEAHGCAMQAACTRRESIRAHIKRLHMSISDAEYVLHAPTAARRREDRRRSHVSLRRHSEVSSTASSPHIPTENDATPFSASEDQHQQQQGHTLRVDIDEAVLTILEAQLSTLDQEDHQRRNVMSEYIRSLSTLVEDHVLIMAAACASTSSAARERAQLAEAHCIESHIEDLEQRVDSLQQDLDDAKLFDEDDGDGTVSNTKSTRGAQLAAFRHLPVEDLRSAVAAEESALDAKRAAVASLEDQLFPRQAAPEDGTMEGVGSDRLAAPVDVLVDLDAILTELRGIVTAGSPLKGHAAPTQPTWQEDVRQNPEIRLHKLAEFSAAYGDGVIEIARDIVVAEARTMEAVQRLALVKEHRSDFEMLAHRKGPTSDEANRLRLLDDVRSQLAKVSKLEHEAGELRATVATLTDERQACHKIVADIADLRSHFIAEEERLEADKETIRRELTELETLKNILTSQVEGMVMLQDDA